MHTGSQLLDAELNEILAFLGKDLGCLRGKKLFITGGTGFIGRWLLETLNFANRVADLNVVASVLTRNPRKIAESASHLFDSNKLQLIEGDIRNFDFPAGEFDCIIHAAADSSAASGSNDPVTVLETSVVGTRRILEFARKCSAENMLFLSSGAVYGKQPPEMDYLPETYAGTPDIYDLKSAYGQGKRISETLCAAYAEQFKINIKIARCFALIGPFLPLNGHFAAGNFIRDAVAGKPVCINGDGTTVRSYLYASDLVGWLFKILLHGQKAYPYNVGSMEAISIRQFAEIVSSQVQPVVSVCIAKKPDSGIMPDRYVPDTSRVRNELKLRQQTDLHEAVARTIRWYQNLLLAGE